MRRVGNNLLWRLAVALGGRRWLEARPADVRRIDFPTQMRRSGLTLSEFLRERLRSRWLRLRGAKRDRDLS
jgi:hypothetical protein